jgi:UDP-N-acetylglucosamine acyltransferase
MSETKTTQAVHRPIGFQMDAKAVISPRAHLGEGVTIGAYAIVGDDVELGAGCKVQPHAVIQGPAKIGRDNNFYPFCSVGCDPQDLKFAGERTELVIGDGNQFREHVTVSRGTGKGGGVTRVGSHNLFMVNAHVAHDCQVGDYTIFANGGTLAGHVTVQDYANVGAYSAVHQFCRVGRHAYIGGFTVVTQDVAPFSIVVSGRETSCFGINRIGLTRRGYSPERIEEIEKAFKLLLRSKLNTTQAIEKMRETMPDSADVQELIGFIETAERGLVK